MKKLTTYLQLTFCCLLVSLATEARAQLEGTLFTKPEEREYLDYLRAEFRRNNPEADFNIEEADIPEIPNAVVVEENAGPEEYSFGGVMTRRDGIRIWLNGKLLAESELPDGFSVVENNRSVSLRIVKDGNTYVLLPGQTVDVTVGTVVENFRRPQPAIAAATSPVAADRIEETLIDAAASATPPGTNAASPQTPAGAQVSEVTTADQESTADPDAALAAATEALDDSEVDALFEILENRRLERTADEGPNEETNSEDP